MIFFIAAGMDQNRRVTGDFIQIVKVNCYKVIFTHTSVITSILQGGHWGSQRLSPAQSHRAGQWKGRIEPRCSDPRPCSFQYSKMSGIYRNHKTTSGWAQQLTTKSFPPNATFNPAPYLPVTHLMAPRPDPQSLALVHLGVHHRPFSYSCVVCASQKLKACPSPDQVTRRSNPTSKWSSTVWHVDQELNYSRLLIQQDCFWEHRKREHEEKIQDSLPNSKGLKPPRNRGVV